VLVAKDSLACSPLIIELIATGDHASGGLFCYCTIFTGYAQFHSAAASVAPAIGHFLSTADYSLPSS